jgi:molybdopterin converting factor small subunit
MVIPIRLFAAARELAHTNQILVSCPTDEGQTDRGRDVDEVVTVRELRDALIEQYPALAPLVAHCRFAVNTSYVDDEAVVRSCDELALIPPVSGG